MSTLIVYASKTGTTEKCARKLAAGLADVHLCDLAKEKPHLADYDEYIVGGPIRNGKLHEDVAQFVTDNETAIMSRPYGLFITCGLIDIAEKELADNFSEELRNGAKHIDAFGGEINMSKQKGMDKYLAQKVLDSLEGRDMDAPHILVDRIEDFSARML